ncbi:hypothetical protein CPB83DRAFT_848183 [Crepidotus variabilis]|uniref:SMP-30/Gluconolactonase/LRE-like region domain-containing protein n=1 Tax=Crepidotus variabilis TaxID=179855 RepID=A0A9P6JTZ2_9AGAR|nr:hypothetical protein CPB83DRAFT_848183 [Crepidotus variabilis]
MSSREIVVQAPWLKVDCILGEGPLYDPSTSTLHFVDITDKKVFHVNTQDLDSLSVDNYDEPITSIALRRNGTGLACTAKAGFAVLEGNSISYITQPIPPDELPHTRFNDGACDSKGRYFAGTIYDNEKGVPGKLYRYDPETATCHVVDEGPFTDSNGLGWSPDESIFYFTDSIVNKIYAYDYQDGELSNRRVFVDCMQKGFPENTFCDGLCIDDQGGVWSARFGGSRIVHFTPDGESDVQIVFPTALNITSCCFGGPNNDQLYVTTAHCGAVGGDASRQERYPDSGHVFCVDLAGQFRGAERRHFAG